MISVASGIPYGLIDLGQVFFWAGLLLWVLLSPMKKDPPFGILWPTCVGAMLLDAFMAAGHFFPAWMGMIPVMDSCLYVWDWTADIMEFLIWGIAVWVAKVARGEPHYW